MLQATAAPTTDDPVLHHVVYPDRPRTQLKRDGALVIDPVVVGHDGLQSSVARDQSMDWLGVIDVGP